jgi:hypothetical protein
MSFSGFRLVSFGLIAILLTSCGGKGLECVDKPQADLDKDPFKNVQVQVGVDGSGSMLAYVKNPGTRYSQAIDSLSDVLQNKPAQYWRIGRGENVTEPQALTANEFLNARKSAFYDCKSPGSNFACVSSSLDQIYTIPKNNPREDALRILLTDLEPDQSAITLLSGKISAELKENRGYKAVLLGVRSEYNGNVFSADTGNVAVPNYISDGTNVDQKGRPFYVLMTGPGAAVDAIVQSLREGTQDVNQAFRVSSFTVDGIDTITLDKTNINQKFEASCMSQTGAIKKTRPARSQIDQWLLLEQSCINQPLSLEIPSEQAITLAGAELTPEMFQISSPAVKLESSTVSEDKVKLKIILNGEQIPKKTGQEIYISLQKRDLDQAIWKNLDTEVKAPDGAKTQNLIRFINNLRRTVKDAVQDPQKKMATQEAIKYCLGLTRTDK